MRAAGWLALAMLVGCRERPPTESRVDAAAPVKATAPTELDLGHPVRAVDVGGAIERTAFVTTIAKDGEADGDEVRLIRWDVDRPSGDDFTRIWSADTKVYTGTPTAAPAAVTKDRVFVVVPLRHQRSFPLVAVSTRPVPRPDPLRAWLVARPRSVVAPREPDVEEDGAVDVSLVANEEWVAVSYRPAPDADVEVHLFGTSDLGEKAKATIPKISRGARLLALTGNRLAFADRSLEIPSLAIHDETFTAPRTPDAPAGCKARASAIGDLEACENGKFRVRPR